MFEEFERIIKEFEKDIDEFIKSTKYRIKDLEKINNEHKMINGKLRNEILQKDEVIKELKIGLGYEEGESHIPRID